MHCHYNILIFRVHKVPIKRINMQKLLFSFDITSARLEFEKHWKLASLTVKLNLKQNIVSLVCIYIYIYIYVCINV